jgi:K+-transporting ATPase KdpF subunit
LTRPLASGATEGIEMNAESILAIVLAVGLIAYLAYSLLRPERF